MMMVACPIRGRYLRTAENGSSSPVQATRTMFLPCLSHPSVIIKN